MDTCTNVVDIRVYDMIFFFNKLGVDIDNMDKLWTKLVKRININNMGFAKILLDQKREMNDHNRS